MYLKLDEKDAEQIAVIEDSGKQYTYGQLCGFVEEFGGWVSERSLIFILCRNTMETIAAHVACIEKRIVPLMISNQMHEKLLERLIHTYEPEYIWMPKDKVIDEGYESVSCFAEYVLVKTGYKKADLNENLAMLLTTSGSTGSPKLVRHSYKNLYANAENVATVFGFTKEDRTLIDLQLHYTMGLNVACSSLYAGAVLLMTTYNSMQREYWSFFDTNEVTNITGVPYNYEILKRLKFFRREYPKLRILAEGGGKLTDEMFREIAEYAKQNGKQFFATFGTSETTARLAYLKPELALEKVGSIGMAIPNGTLTLADENGEEIQETEACGELVYSGPNVTLGYAYQKEDLNKGDERQGTYYTGDMARRDTDGCYYIIGRKSRFLKLFGYRVSLDESERIIRDAFSIEVACAGTDEKMKIYVTQDGLEQEIRKYLAEKTKIQMAAFEVIVIPEIPKNEVGKILYGSL